jgi:Icc-related predicted phosphoesterase
MQLRVLSVSDRVEEVIYSPNLRQRFKDIDFTISCGDLPYYYVEYIVSTLDKPVFFVRGNHAKALEQSESGSRTAPQGAVNMHRNNVRYSGVLLAGVEGSIRYKLGPYQYSQNQMWMNVFSLIPGLISNRIQYGRYLDILITHAAPWGINDRDDWPHQGIKAFRWLIDVFKPRYHFHGHIHLYGPKVVPEIDYNQTQVINTYGYRLNILNLDGK